MIVTQPGRVQTSAGGLFAVGYTTRNGAAVSPASSPLDVAPTVLANIGLPLSRELAGQPIPFGPRPSADRHVASYGKPFVETGTRSGKPLDQETIDRLRSLGYIK